MADTLKPQPINPTPDTADALDSRSVVFGLRPPGQLPPAFSGGDTIPRPARGLGVVDFHPAAPERRVEGPLEVEAVANDAANTELVSPGPVSAAVAARGVAATITLQPTEPDHFKATLALHGTQTGRFQAGTAHPTNEPKPVEAQVVLPTPPAVASPAAVAGELRVVREWSDAEERIAVNYLLDTTLSAESVLSEHARETGILRTPGAWATRLPILAKRFAIPADRFADVLGYVRKLVKTTPAFVPATATRRTGPTRDKQRWTSAEELDVIRAATTAGSAREFRTIMAAKGSERSSGGYAEHLSKLIHRKVVTDPDKVTAMGGMATLLRELREEATVTSAVFVTNTSGPVGIVAQPLVPSAAPPSAVAPSVGEPMTAAEFVGLVASVGEPGMAPQNPCDESPLPEVVARGEEPPAPLPSRPPGIFEPLRGGDTFPEVRVGPPDSRALAARNFADKVISVLDLVDVGGLDAEDGFAAIAKLRVRLYCVH